MIGRFFDFFQQNGFVLELLLCNVLFTYAQEKRSRYVQRLALSCAVLLGSAVMLNRVPIQSVHFNFIKYMVWFFLATVSNIFCCRMAFIQALFCGISAYVCQHMSFKVGDVAVHFLCPYLGPDSASVLYVFSVLVMYVICFFAYARQVRVINEHFVPRHRFLFLCLGVAVYTSVLQYIFAAYVAHMPDAVYLTYASLDVVCCFFALSTQYGLFLSSKLEEEQRLMEQILHMQEEKFRISRETVELINIKCHDLKKQLATVQGLEREELKRLYQTLNVYDMSVKTGNETLDIILAEKSLLCQQEQIQLECMSSGASLQFIRPSDIYAIFGNAIDNAIESVLKVYDLNKRYISLSLKETRGMIVFHIENPYEGQLEFENGDPMTTKPNKAFHGYGMKSIRMTVGKYGGCVSVVTTDQLFSLNVSIPLPSAASCSVAGQSSDRP